MANREIETEAKTLIESLQRMREDRGALAALRSTWVRSRERKAWPVLARLGALGDPTKRYVAGLYALNPAHTGNPEDGRVGAVCAKLSSEHASFDLRFRRLLACNRRELPRHVRRVVMAAAARALPIDYTELYRDMQFWGDGVRFRWAKDYYRHYQPKREEP